MKPSCLLMPLRASDLMPSVTVVPAGKPALSRVVATSGDRPRTLITWARPATRCADRPGSRAINSAMLVSGSLPMSSAVTSRVACRAYASWAVPNSSTAQPAATGCSLNPSTRSTGWFVGAAFFIRWRVQPTQQRALPARCAHGAADPRHRPQGDRLAHATRQRRRAGAARYRRDTGADARPGHRPAARRDAGQPADAGRYRARRAAHRPGRRGAGDVAAAQGRWSAQVDISRVAEGSIAHQPVAWLPGQPSAAAVARDFRVRLPWTRVAQVSDPAGDDRGPDRHYSHCSDAGWGTNRQVNLLEARVWLAGGALCSAEGASASNEGSRSWAHAAPSRVQPRALNRPAPPAARSPTPPR